MISLSFSTISNCLQPTNSHCWINRISGRKPQNRMAYVYGTENHRIIQNHLDGSCLDERIKHIDYFFPIVEKEDKDPKCIFRFEVGGFNMFGFVDGLNPQEKRMLEIKTGSQMWSIKRYLDSYQRKIYALGFPEYEEALLITAVIDNTLWSSIKPKKILVPLTKKDKEEAEEYIVKAIELLKKGDFTGGLSEGKCTGYCYYGSNCLYR